MKKALLLIFCLTMSMMMTAQKRSVTLQISNETLTTALKQIEKMGEKNILFTYDETDKYRVTANIKQKTQHEAINIVLQGKPFHIVERNTYYAIQHTGKSTAKKQTHGKVVDEQQQPLGYANVVMLSAKDQKYIGACVTASDGSFVLPFPAEGTQLKVTFIGYKTTVVESKGEQTIMLQPEAHQLKGVTVTSKRPQVNYKNGAFVTNVAGTTLGEMGSASEMIGHLPFVAGDEGNWNVIGRGTPEIYLNGRKLTDISELNRIDAKDIQKAEIIVLPGARYDNSTNAVIRLQAVRKRGQGLSGNFNTTYRQARRAPSTSENVHLNYRTGGLDIFGEAGVRLGISRGTIHTQTSLQTTDLWQVENQREGKSNIGAMHLQAGFNYETKDHQSFGMRYEGNRDIGNNYSHSWGTTEALKNGQVQEKALFESMSHTTPHWAHSLNTYYNAQLGKWEIDFNGDYYKKTSESSSWSANDGHQDAASQSKENSTLYATKLVLTTDLWKGQFSIGTEETFTDRRDDFTQSGYSEDAFNQIKQTAVAGFVEYYKTLGHFNIGGGLRYEYQKTTYYNKGVLQEDRSPSYSNLIPILNAGYSNGDLSLGLAYRLYKNSPSYSMLQSSVSYDSKYMYSTGDPLLKPQFQHFISMTGNYKWVAFQAYYAFVKDMYTTWFRPYDATNHPEILLQAMATIPHSYVTGASVSLSPSFGIWQPRLTTSVSYYHENVKHLGLEVIGNDPKFSFSLDNSFKLPKKWFVNLIGTVSTRAAQGHGDQRCKGNVRLSVSKKMLKNDALRIGLTVHDMLHTDYYYFKVMGTQSSFDSSKYGNNQSISLNVRYTFNATKDKYKGKGAGEDEKQRL